MTDHRRNTVTPEISAAPAVEDRRRPASRRGVLIAAGTALALAGSLSTAAAAPAPAAAPRSGAGGLSVEGIWRMDGYGTVVSVHGRDLRFWDTTELSCLPGPTARSTGGTGPGGAVRFDSQEYSLTVTPRAGDRAALRVHGSLGPRSLRRIAALPPLCEQPPPTGPVATFDIFWQTFKENYAFFERRGVDWDEMRARYRPSVHAGTTQEELFGILSAMALPLQDAHVGLEASDLGRSASGQRAGTVSPDDAYDQRIQAFVERRNLGGTALETHAQGAIGYAELPGGIGYLRIGRFGGYTPGSPTIEADAAELDRVLDRIVTRARAHGPGAWRGLVVDVRVNQGGSDDLGLQIAARLTDRGYAAYRKEARNDPRDDSRFTPRYTARVAPAQGVPRYTGPIAVLASGATVSAGETFVKALAERPSPTTLIGEHTQGALSDIMARELPNGWRFGLSNERYTTPRGNSHEGPGVPPHITVPVFTAEEFAADRDSAFDRAITLLTRRR
ncbi:S41 family peptidase [Streptomyces qinzhouensis]|uniref:S41 family peptidase n=1 Tax=Streptomyces qinzhouensis TaxID=2599401 RepID=A0A5B8INK1_9ACTN|nr:S41 family peptidase [Streptomyces qinzhouensis]